MQRTQVQFLLWEDSTFRRATEPVSWSPRTTTTEAPHALELALHTRDAITTRSPHTSTRVQPPLSTTRESSYNSEDPAQPKIIQLLMARYKHLNAEIQRIARRDKKAFLSDQCKEIEENNRMGKTIDLFKKIRYQGNISCKDGARYRSEMVWT